LKKEAVNKKLDRLDKVGTCYVVDKNQGEKNVGHKRVFKMKRRADRSMKKFHAGLGAEDFSQGPRFDFEETNSPIIRFEFLW
jgi:hypothetical protein